MRIEIFIVLAYLVIMVGIGLAFTRLNQSGDDFFKSGAKGSWWLVGMSVFMAGLSANTFTANGGVAYRAGWTVLLVYWAGSLGAFFQILYFAKRYRRTRKATLPEIIQERFGTGAQQVYSWVNVPSAVLHAGIWLWGMGIFTASAFQLDINLVIVVVGTVVTLMACSGGSWAVMASDFVQSLIIFSIVVLLSTLVLIDFGGPTSFFHALHTHTATSEYSFFKPAGEFADDKFTLGWAMAQMAITVIMLCSVEGSVRFLAVKDDKTAIKSAWLVMILMLIFPVIIFIPAWGSALALGNEVQAAGGVTPAESAYAVAARHWLPPQLLGLMGVAMLAATMSSMDTGINRSAGIVVRNIIPFILDLRGKKRLGAHAELRVGRIFSLLFGGCSILLALLYHNLGTFGVFELLLLMSTLLHLPLAIPLLLGMLYRKTPSWAAFSSMGLGFAVSLYSLLAPHIGHASLNYQERALWVSVMGVAGFFVGRIFWKNSPDKERSRIDAFFTMLRTPIDFAREIGQANDRQQARVIGGFGLALGLCMTPLFFICKDTRSIVSLIALIIFVIGICGSLFAWGLKKEKGTDHE